MKHIIESIIGRKARKENWCPGRMWLLIPMGKDVRNAEKYLPDDCIVEFNKTLVNRFGYILTENQVRRFLNYINYSFNSYDSALYHLNPDYFKDFADVEEFASHNSPWWFGGGTEELTRVFNLKDFAKVI